MFTMVSELYRRDGGYLQSRDQTSREFAPNVA